MIPCLFNLGTGELIIIFVVILLLFGAKRIPELARSLGKGINSFKQGMNDVSAEMKKGADETGSDSSTLKNGADSK
ncbi:MAG: twin-arginine translocase TatA/TatE family subunit [Duncaniella sp.]|nr:twin-arginine translocase TatA/TatE family subunit [Duncaniella sp.]